MLSSPVWILGWSLVALAQNYEMVLFARVLTGFCVGLVTPSAAVYVSCNFVIVYLIYASFNFVVFDHHKSNINSCSLIYTWCVQVLRSPKEAFAAAMQSWRERCEKCVCLQGDYVVKLLHFSFLW